MTVGNAADDEDSTPLLFDEGGMLVVRGSSALAGSAALVAGLVVAPWAAAGKGYVHRAERSDVTLARVSVARAADFASAGWSGGTVRPDRSNEARACLAYRPKRSDLVVTGDARSVFHYRNLVTLETRARVFASRRMLDLQWQRFVRDRRSVSCLQTDLKRAIGRDATLLSLTKLHVPRFARHTAAWRAIGRVSTRRGAVDIVADLVVCADDRTEVSLVQVATLSDAGTPPGMRIGEAALAKSLVSRLEV